MYLKRFRISYSISLLPFLVEPANIGGQAK